MSGQFYALLRQKAMTRVAVAAMRRFRSLRCISVLMTLALIQVTVLKELHHDE
jgi:hypothetical protein